MNRLKTFTLIVLRRLKVDNSQLNIDYVTITNVDANSFDRKQSYYGKPKGLKGIQKRQKELEQRIDTITNAISILTDSGCSSFIPQIIPKYSMNNWGLCNPETKELVYDPRDSGDPNYSEAMFNIERCLEKYYRTNWLVQFLDKNGQNIKPIELERILERLDPVVEKANEELLSVQKEYEEASKPVTVKDWKLIFVFDKANVIVKGQIAKNLYMDLEKVGSEINLKMHIDKVKHFLYETKLALIVDSYEIL